MSHMLGTAMKEKTLKEVYRRQNELFLYVLITK